MTPIDVGPAFARPGFSIYWIVDGDTGGAIGEVSKSRDPEVTTAYAVAEPYADEKPHRQGFVFHTEAKARRAEAAVRRALKTALAVEAAKAAAKPWPKWALRAVEAGWKAPRGWTP